ncbi:hypothetical protein SDC9_96561 [bioreactor metagenome]|uniref:Uncharacterized protein n=1 Tax=bioreactor metagenome TaxID=1076179 RepID=A0A645A9G4_9ZZZZ
MMWFVKVSSGLKGTIIFLESFPVLSKISAINEDITVAWSSSI